MTEITICSGTLCHIMGGAELFEIEDKLLELFNEPVQIKAAPCLGKCQGTERLQPPCILINGEPMAEATIEKIIEKLNLEKKK